MTMKMTAPARPIRKDMRESLLHFDKTMANRHRAMVSDGPGHPALAHRIDLLEERMDMEPAEIEAAAERLRAMVKREGAVQQLRIDMVKRDDAMKRFRTDAAKRNAANTRWMIGAIAATIMIILGGISLIVGG
ncbi:MAG: hypothetical protein OXF56_24675 [Rhodobacteraceae bacterium]|nr:hypothetical protein [Paracoccaceae bacterium]